MQVGKHKGRTFEDIFKNEKAYVSWVKTKDDATGPLLVFRQYVLEQEKKAKDSSNLQKSVSGGYSQHENENGSYSNSKNACSRNPSSDFSKFNYNSSFFNETRVSSEGVMDSFQNTNRSIFENSGMTIVDGEHSYSKTPMQYGKTSDVNQMNSNGCTLNKSSDMNQVQGTSSIPTKPIEFDLVLAIELYSEEFFRIVQKSANGKKHGQFSSFLPKELYQLLQNYNPIIQKVDKRSNILFEASKYEYILNILKERCLFSGGIIEVPSFLLKCFKPFSCYSKPMKLNEKTADVLCRTMIGYTKENVDRLDELLGDKLRNELKPFQKEGVMFGLKNNGRVLIGDEMGLGKTLQALALMAFYQKDWPFLVICPSSIRFQWKDQALEWLSHLLTENNICVVKNGKMEIPEGTKMIIISYELFASNLKFQQKFRSVICDESHYIKNPNTKRTKAIVPVVKEANRCVLLSGTPTLNRSSELFEQIDCILPGLVKYEEFCKRYCFQEINKFSRRTEYTGAKHSEELHLLLTNTIMIRRLKRDVMKELPKKIRCKIPIEVTAKDLKRLQNVMTHLQTTDQIRIDANGFPTFRTLNNKQTKAQNNELSNSTDVTDSMNVSALYKMTGLAKVNALIEYMSYLVDSDIKFIMFCHHIEVMDQITDHMEKAGWNYIRIDGSTPMDDREKLIKEYQTKPQLQIALLSLSACGTGLNITAASTVVFGELSWVPGTLAQGEDRAHRMGSAHEEINVHYLVAQGTFDEMLWRIVNLKSTDVSTMLDGKQEDLNAQYIERFDELMKAMTSGETKMFPSSLVTTPKRKRKSFEYVPTPTKGPKTETDIRHFFKTKTDHET